ncbi:MAG: hypothetical protein PHG36_03655 [Dehalococcoidia bacterium]|nr:hypothetical protein [Dehalococcoidia bacterium]
MMILDGEQKIALTVMRENELIDLHFSLGMAIRNAFGLHVPGSKLPASCGVAHSDSANYYVLMATMMTYPVCVFAINSLILDGYNLNAGIT